MLSSPIEKFLLPFFLSLGLTVIGVVLLLWLGKKSAKRLGGLILIIVFGISVLLNKDLEITRSILGILIGSSMIFLFGLWDDLKNINWKWQLIFQIIIALAAISFGVRSGFISNPLGGAISLNNPAIYYFFYILYFLIFLNSLNWLDGTDGLAGGVTLVSLGTIFFLSFKPEVNQPATAILCAISGGAVLGFLFFNWNPAKILAGTSGAWFFGFILASLSIFAGAKIATVMMAALIPILDLVRVVWERWRSGQSIFQKDHRHLHYLLLNAGINERKIFFLYFFASVLIGSAALNLRVWGKLATIASVIIIYSLSFYLWSKKQKS
ncbi:MAG: MraY family glycosyltransferase [Candidatus Moranbacteria bacterium]|nr:MraY family glycosyltransferase [Candidatus Moranbacteria bacterium]